MNRRQKRQINKELAAIASLKDSDIDTSDIPEITDWSQAVRGMRGSPEMATFGPATAGAGSKSQPLSEPDAQQFTGIVLSETAVETQPSGAALTEMTSQQLIVHCLQGQDTAWAEFVRRFQKLIAGVVVRAAREWGNTSRQVIEDLIQDTYVKLSADNFQLLRRFDPRHENAILGFLKVVASSAVYDHFRAAGVMRRRSEESVLETLPGFADTVAQAETEILLEEINRLLEIHASERDHAIFWLYYRQGETAQSIAAIPKFGLTVKGVESVIFRLTQALKRELTQASPTNRLQEGAVALPLTDLSEHSFDQLLRHTQPSPKKKS